MIYCTRLLFLAFLFVGIWSCENKVSDKNLQSKEIKNGWHYAEVGGKHKGKATVPGVIQTDLLANKQIKAPFFRTNERDLQWIDKKDWVYTTTFEISENEIKYNHLQLNFKGLDTYANVYLNDSLLLKTDNMFRQWSCDIKPFAKHGKNQLRIYFYSPIKKGLELLAASPYGYPAGNDQSEIGGVGDKKVSVFTRKAGYHYGWDWGPRFVTIGVWRPVYLEMWNNMRINNSYIEQHKINKNIAQLNAKISVNSDNNDSVFVTISNKNNNTIYVDKKIDLQRGVNIVNLPFSIRQPRLWWCNGLGKANMYDFDISIKKGAKLLAQQIVSTGLRSLKLIRKKDKFGESFLFELNGVKVFAKGANYIPNDSFLPRVTNENYKKVIADAKNANMNMLRVWGGGIYENNLFYDLCDRNGIMLWQDFMFACSMYPGNKSFLESIKQEAIDNVVRLRNHPCIALWCGNNEINIAWRYGTNGGWGWKQRYTKLQQEELQKAYMDIFHKILPDVLKNYTYKTDYWPSSPQAGYNYIEHASSTNTSGDMHYWGVWHEQHPFKNFEKYKARFMSEYGFQSFPDFETVQTYTIPDDYDIESEVMTAHQRSGIGNLRIKSYMQADYKLPIDFSDFLYLGQVLQAKGIKQAIEAHRRAMPYCMGSLYWQINDCWPVASWSSTDYYHKWKAMHYTVKRAYEKVIVSGVINDKNELNTFVVSDKLSELKGELLVTALNFNGDTINTVKQKACVKANGSTLVGTLLLNDLLKNNNIADVVVVLQLKLGDKIIAVNNLYPAKPKSQKLPNATIRLSISKEKGKTFVTVSSNKLVRDIYLNIKNCDEFFSDNYFDLLPGETRKIELLGATNPKVSDIEITHLGNIKYQ